MIFVGDELATEIQLGGAPQPDGHDGHPRLDREVADTALERRELRLGVRDAALGEDADHRTLFEKAEDRFDRAPLRASVTRDRHGDPERLDDEPLPPDMRHRLAVADEVHAWLRGENVPSGENSGQAPDPAALLQLAYDAAARLSSEGMQTLWPIGRDGKPRVPETLTVDLRAGRVWFTGGSLEPVPGDEGGAFEREHPFAANALIARRLLDGFGISVGKEIEGFTSSWSTAPYFLEIAWPGRQPTPFESGRVSEFVVSERDFRVAARNRPADPPFTSTGRARFAWAHRIETPPGRPSVNPMSAPPGFAPIRLWFDPWGAASELALYDALCQVERWAKRSLARST